MSYYYSAHVVFTNHHYFIYLSHFEIHLFDRFIIAADGGVSTVPMRGLPRSPALASHRRQQQSQAKNCGARPRQDLQRWYQILPFSLARIYLVSNMLVRLDLNWYQICNMQCSSSRGTEEGDRAATPTIPPAADQGHHRWRRHRHCRLDAGQARAARVRGCCHSIAEVIVDRRNACQLALCWFFWGAVHRVQRHTC